MQYSDSNQNAQIDSATLQKMAAAQQAHTLTKGYAQIGSDASYTAIQPAPEPPLTDRIESLLNAAYEHAAITTQAQYSLLNRLFGPSPVGGSNSAGQSPRAEPVTFEDRVFARLQSLIAVLSENRDLAERLATRI